MLNIKEFGEVSAYKINELSWFAFGLCLSCCKNKYKYVTL